MPASTDSTAGPSTGTNRHADDHSAHSTAPRRIQLSRRPGYRKPPDAIVVTRASKHWGNPFDVATYGRDQAIELYRAYLRCLPVLVALIRRDLAGRDLACFCLLDQPCHADVLLRVAAGGDL